jgi:neutral ceramidase
MIVERLTRISRVIWLGSIALLAATTGYAAEPASSWRAGAAAITITPETPMWLSGYVGRDKPAEGKLSDLHAKALVLEDPTGRRAVVVTMDLVGISREVSAAVCAELKAKYQFPREAIFLSVSHTHSGPVIVGNLSAMYSLDETQARLVDEYSEALKSKLVGLVGTAVTDLAPADLSSGRGYVTFAVNRRTNPEGSVAKLRMEGRLKGPIDHDVPVLAVRAKDGKVRAVLFGYACHATVLSGYQWSADYPGAAQAAVEIAHPGAVALFFAGCGADQNPLPRRGASMAETYGRELARGVADVLKAPMSQITGRLGLSYEEVELPLAELPSRDKLIQDTTSTHRATANRAKKLVADLDKGIPLHATYPYPIQVWQFGPDLSLVTLGGEDVVDYSLRLKRELGRESTWVAAYANDVMAYIPSLRVLKEGGYEGGGSMPIYGLPAVWAPKIEEMIVAAVHKQVEAARASEAHP